VGQRQAVPGQPLVAECPPGLVQRPGDAGLAEVQPGRALGVRLQPPDGPAPRRGHGIGHPRVAGELDVPGEHPEGARGTDLHDAGVGRALRAGLRPQPLVVGGIHRVEEVADDALAGLTQPVVVQACGAVHAVPRGLGR
jgi:hypothetical protein